MKLSSSGHSWQPSPFRFQLQVCTNTQEAEKIRKQLIELLIASEHLTADGGLKKASQRNDAVRLVHWLAMNFDQNEHKEQTL